MSVKKKCFACALEETLDMMKDAVSLSQTHCFPKSPKPGDKVCPRCVRKNKK